MNKLDNPVESSLIGAGLLWAALVVPVLSGCEGVRPVNQVAAPTPQERLAQVVDHGEGVYEFRADKEFPKTLAHFRKEHKNERVVSVSQGLDYRVGYGNRSVGLSDSFIVVTEPASK